MLQDIPSSSYIEKMGVFWDPTQQMHVYWKFPGVRGSERGCGEVSSRSSLVRPRVEMAELL